MKSYLYGSGGGFSEKGYAYSYNRFRRLSGKAIFAAYAVNMQAAKALACPTPDIECSCTIYASSYFNEDGHMTECEECHYAFLEPHYGVEATCTTRARCSAFFYEYGPEPLGHSFTNYTSDTWLMGRRHGRWSCPMWILTVLTIYLVLQKGQGTIHLIIGIIIRRFSPGLTIHDNRSHNIRTKDKLKHAVRYHFICG